MAERQLSDVPDILEANVFDSGMSIIFSMSGRFRDIASLLLRNAISKAIIHAEASDPADSDQVSGLTQYWINTTTKARFISVNGEDWVNVTSPGTTGQGEDGDDGWTPEFSVVSDTVRRVLQVSDWTGGGGSKPATGQYVGATGFVSAIADAVDIRGPVGQTGGTGGAGNDGEDGWSPEIAIESDDARRVLKVVDWHGGDGTKPDINRYLGEDGFTTELNLAIDIRGASGLGSISTDETLQGDGTTDSPLGVVPVLGEIGRILSIGSYTLGASTTPAAQNAGYTGGNLYIHTTASDGDKSTILGGLSQGDYIHVGTDAILEITSPPTSASSIYTLAVTVLEGEVPASDSHTIYFIKENRALIAGSVHGFNIAAGSILVSKLAQEVISYWLRSVATDATLTGDGTSGSPLSVAVPADDSPPDVDTGMYETFGSWTWTSTSVPATGHFYVESGELRIFETDTDSTDKRTALDDVAVGDRFQFGELNAFEVSAVGVRSGNGLWTFSGNWAEVFDVGDFDGSYNVRYIRKANVLARNNVAPGRYLRLNSSLLVEANDPRDNLETLWTGSISPDDADDLAATHNLNAGRKFSDYKVLFFRSRGRNRPTWNACPATAFASSSNLVEIDTRGIAATLGWVSDTSFRFTHSYGSDFQLQRILGMKGA